MNIPLSLYIHFPWCIQKCPYCDFNSHELQTDLPEDRYIDALIKDFQNAIPDTQGREVQTIFMGGGTPSLFSANSLNRLLQSLKALSPIADQAEITLEANPGATEAERFQAYREIGINRLSIGAQSFDDTMLKKLGRIHNAEQTHRAINLAKQARFYNFNIDIMYGLPAQNPQQALNDLTYAIETDAPHISWYELTLEPNTIFYNKPPMLPPTDTIDEIDQLGKDLLHQNGYRQYEVSAFAKSDQVCKHNLNYWTFGDYVGIGAGAHSKITDLNTGEIHRYQKKRQPKNYLEQNTPHAIHREQVPTDHIDFEFMLNALRLHDPLLRQLYEERTKKAWSSLTSVLSHAQAKNLLQWDQHSLALTPQGHRYLNDVTQLFLP